MTYKLVLFLISILFLQTTCFSQVSGERVDPGRERPNIIFILTDDQRWDALGYAGNELIQTKEMDKLAKEGVYFKNAVVTTPICAASRASILSGLYERAHGYNFQTSGLKEEFMQTSYPHFLREAGYYTGFYGKLGVRYEQKEELFDAYEFYDREVSFKDRRGYYHKTLEGDTVHLTRYTGQKALDFIENVPDKGPFCLSLSFSAPHAHDPAEDQYFWQEATDPLLQNTEIPGPSLSEDRYFDALPEEVKAGFNRLRWTWRYDTPEKYQHSVKGYYRMITGIDLEIARIRQLLKEKRMNKNTVIIIMGDNGYFMGERQLAGKWLLYDNSLRVPLIIYDPRVGKHQDLDQMALNIDIPPTILDLAGVKPPDSWHGKSLLPIVAGRTRTLERDTILIEHLWDFENIPPSEGVRTRDWKYFRYVNDKSIEELYDLKHDPEERDNLAKKKKYQDVLMQLREKCDDLIHEHRDPHVGLPSGLMVEFIREPAGVLLKDDQPEYSWIVPQAAVLQSAYQVLVASSKDNIDKNIGDIWDSGQIRGNSSSNVEHGGDNLKKSLQYFWKVRVWDEFNRLGAYSPSQSFKYDGSGNEITTPNILQPKLAEQMPGSLFEVDFGNAALADFDEHQSSFLCSDTVLNRRWNLCKKSIETTPFAGTHGHRRSTPYDADAYINQLGHYSIDREYAFGRWTTEYLMDNPAWPTEWQLQMPLMFYQDYMHTGNTELITQYYEVLKQKSQVDLVREDGLIRSEEATPELMRRLGFMKKDLELMDIGSSTVEGGELDGYVFKPINTVVNSFFYRNMQIMALFAGLLNKPEEATDFEMIALKVKKAINEKLFDKQAGVYVDGEGTSHASLHANMMALAFNIVPDSRVESVSNFIKSRGMACSVYGFQFLLEGLYQAGEADAALRLMTDTQLDWSYAWGVLPNIISRKMWGITPKTPGGNIMSIRPRLSKLSSSQIKVPMIKGSITASYQWINEISQRYIFKLPANVSGDLLLEYSPGTTIILNGEKVNLTFETIRLSPGVNEVELRINSF